MDTRAIKWSSVLSYEGAFLETAVNIACSNVLYHGKMCILKKILYIVQYCVVQCWVMYIAVDVVALCMHVTD